MKVWFERREELAPGIWQYYFRPERPVDFIPGQYADFHILQPIRDPRGQARVFSFTSLPTDELVSFVAKFVAPLSPYKQALQALQPGNALRLDDAMGDLVLPKSPETPLVFIAGGIGIASFVSMFRQLLQTRQERPIFLFYALRSRTEQIYQDVISAYPLQLYSKTITPHRLTADEIIDAVPPQSLIYLSGSQSFVEGLCADLLAAGVPHEQVILDYFDGYADL
ncbi:MAG TPA: FAD-dependent oxidoreductase [Candidatus Saccharimonadales bacterium]|nr:FAD-dependent oxidoreductase [Candidatus Saccharimonadales bacterium]